MHQMQKLFQNIGKSQKVEGEYVAWSSSNDWSGRRIIGHETSFQLFKINLIIPACVSQLQNHSEWGAE